ncbi:MAG: rhodanese-like domain-containing protein [Hyphomicrobiaceae bacterium]
MPKEIAVSAKALVESARREIEEIAPGDVVALHGRDDIAIIDVRDIRELKREGKIPGSVHCPRGMLEFWIDPENPYFKPIFGEDKRFIFHCALDWRSALATQTAQNMGLKPVAHIKGGFAGWKEAGGAVEDVD